MIDHKVSIILPAKNEASSLKTLLPSIKTSYPQAEIIVVNDGSTDETISICQALQIICISHPYSKGNGAAIKSGVRAATGDILVFMDADGQHRVEDIHLLLDKIADGFDMVVGSRDRTSQASFTRLLGNGLYNRLATWMVNQKVLDLTSGFRAAKKELFFRFLYLLPNGFSYPTTSTMAFFRAGYSVGYVPVDVRRREGESHLNVFRDGVKFFIIIFKIGTLYSPLKIFFPVSQIFFLSGLANYAYTYITSHRFTNMSVLMISASVIIFLIGLISEQISSLMYQGSDVNRES